MLQFGNEVVQEWHMLSLNTWALSLMQAEKKAPRKGKILQSQFFPTNLRCTSQLRSAAASVLLVRALKIPQPGKGVHCRKRDEGGTAR